MCRNAERLRKVFSVLGDVNNYPLFYHCRIGTDRTGICGVAINGLFRGKDPHILHHIAQSHLNTLWDEYNK